MKAKTVIPFLVAVALGVFAVIYGRDLLKRQGNQGPSREYAKVLAVTRDLEPGHQIEAKDLSVIEMPAESVPQTAVQNKDDVIGRVVATPMAGGQTVVQSALAARDAGPGLQALVAPGMRAVTVEVNEYSGMTGLLLPGSNVDVLATFIDEQTRQTIAKTILENVKVSAVGTIMVTKPPAGETGPTVQTRSVTLMVTPRQAEMIELATSKSRPRLVLRSRKDTASVMTAGVTMSELLGHGVPLSGDSMDKIKQMMKDMVDAHDRAAAARAPATQPIQPAVAIKTPEPQLIARRTVQVIKGGVESPKVFQDEISTGPSKKNE